MSVKIEELSVFFPCYNVEHHVEGVVRKAWDILEQVADKWEVILVEDGSEDSTKEIVNKLAKENKNTKVIAHKKNKGYGAALTTGLYASKYKWIAFTDSDGQFDFNEIKKFIKKQKESKADMVIGYYLSRKVSVMRKLNTWAWETLVNILFGLGVRDIDTGFKLISKKVVDTIPKLESERGAFIESEFLVKAKKAKFEIVQVGVHHYPRSAGHGTGADLKVIVKSFADLFRLWKKLK